jgi:hypothetical protein
MQYDELELARVATTIAAGLSRDSNLLRDVHDREKVRTGARDLARLSVMIARHIVAAAHGAALKVDEIELLYDDADFL